MRRVRRVKYFRKLWTKRQLTKKFGKRRANKIWYRRNPISRKFDKRSIRTIKRGRAMILVGCPRGSWMPRRKRCRKGMRFVERRSNPSQEILRWVSKGGKYWVALRQNSDGTFSYVSDNGMGYFGKVSLADAKYRVRRIAEYAPSKMYLSGEIA